MIIKKGVEFSFVFGKINNFLGCKCFEEWSMFVCEILMCIVLVME